MHPSELPTYKDCVPIVRKLVKQGKANQVRKILAKYTELANAALVNIDTKYYPQILADLKAIEQCPFP